MTKDKILALTAQLLRAENREVAETVAEELCVAIREHIRSLKRDPAELTGVEDS